MVDFSFWDFGRKIFKKIDFFYVRVRMFGENGAKWCLIFTKSEVVKTTSEVILTTSDLVLTTFEVVFAILGPKNRGNRVVSPSCSTKIQNILTKSKSAFLVF